MRLGKSNLSAVEKITIVLMNLLHLPISALFHQDIILHIQAVYQWQVRSMHSLIRVWFLNPFRLPKWDTLETKKEAKQRKAFVEYYQEKYGFSMHN